MPKNLEHAEVVYRNLYIQKILHTDEWPRWPILPLVRRDGTKPEVAVLIDTHKGALLYEGVNMFSLWRELSNHEPLTLTPEQIYDRGWRVD